MKRITNILKWFAEAAKNITIVSTFIVAISTLFWVFAENEIRDGFANLSGSAEILERINSMQETQTEIQISLESLQRRLRNIEPQSQLVEFNELRSGIVDDCFVGEECHYLIFARQNPDFESCRVQDVEGILRDGLLFQHTNIPVDSFQLSNDWFIIDSTFIVPDRAIAGPSEFTLSITYENCPFENLNIRSKFIMETPSGSFLTQHSIGLEFILFERITNETLIPPQ